MSPEAKFQQTLRKLATIRECSIQDEVGASSRPSAGWR